MEKISKIKILAVSFVMASAMTGTAMAEPLPSEPEPSTTAPSSLTTVPSSSSCAPAAPTKEEDCDPCLTEGKTREYTECQAKVNGANTNLPGTLKNVLQIVIGFVGILSVVMIIFGGIQYTTSAGDAQKVTKAKNTILYAIIGLVISLLAFAIVTWVLGNV